MFHRSPGARFAARAALVVCCAMLGTSCTKGSEPSPIEAEVQKRLDEIRSSMSRGESPVVACAGTRTYTEPLSKEKGTRSAALIAQIKSLCDHEAPVAFAKVALAKMADAGPPNECAAVQMALADVAAEHKQSPAVRELAAKHKQVCPYLY